MEHPGTAVMWEDQCFEVVSAEASAGGGVCYVLEPWRDEHVIRVLDHYDDQTERRRLYEYDEVRRQQKQSTAASLSAMALGHLPAVVQNRLGNELGLSPSRMTILSCVPPLVLFGICVYLGAGAVLEERGSPVPLWLMLLAGAMLFESAVRFQIAMSQSRGVGSLLGTLMYIPWWLVALHRDPLWSPFRVERGSALFTLPPPDDVARRDAVEWRGLFFSLLSAREQAFLEQHYGYDYRRHAFGLAWTILVISGAGSLTSLARLLAHPTVSLTLSFLLATFLAIEQIRRLRHLRRGPAGSIAGAVVRPFLRKFLPGHSG